MNFRSSTPSRSASPVTFAPRLCPAFPFAFALHFAFVFAPALARALALARDLDRVLAHDLDLVRDHALARIRALDLFIEELDFMETRVAEESVVNLLYVDACNIEETDTNPFLRFLYDKNIDEDFVEKFYKTFVQIDAKRFENSTVDDLIAFMNEGIAEGLSSVDTARVIVLGNGNAGKTALIKKLVDQNKNTSKEKMTPRVEISHNKVEEVEVDYWDFGGQVMMHSTHTFFMTAEAVYIIVCNARADEQPDSWLEMLSHTLASSSKIRVLIVYTHLDSKEEINNFDKYKKNMIHRKYGDRFELSCHLHSSEKIDKTQYALLKSKLDDAIKEKGAEATLSDTDKLYKKAENTFIKAKEIKGDSTKEEAESKIRELLRVGYIFPIHPLKESIVNYTYDEEQTFVWQKHWLTYGVYALINHEKTKGKSGFITKANFKEILFKGKEKYILKNGQLARSKPKTYSEKIQYDSEGINILYEIVLNYKWAILNASKREELIFPHAIREDEPDDTLLQKYMNVDDDSIVLTILLDQIPIGFFFEFVTLCDTHIQDPSLLWRSGVVLFDQMDKESFAYVQMHAHKMEIRINGKHKHFLMQFILYYLTMLTRNDTQSRINPKVMKRIGTEDGYRMIDLSLVSAFSDEEQRDKLLKEIKKEGIKMSTTIFNGNVDARGAAIGDGNTVNNYNATVNYVSEIKEILSKIDDPESKTLLLEAEEILESKEDTDTWRDKTKAFGTKVLGYAKNINVADKALGVVAEHSASLMKWAEELLKNSPT